MVNDISCIRSCSFVAIVFISMHGHLAAGSFASKEGRAIDQLKNAIDRYADFHNGQVPTSWDQLVTVNYSLERLNEEARGTPSYPVEDHYAFVTQPVSIPTEGSAVMIGRIPIESGDAHKLKRIVICKKTNGAILTALIPEETVQAAFQNAGVALPPPPGASPAQKPEIRPLAHSYAALSRAALFTAVCVFIAAAAIWWVIWRKHKTPAKR